MAPKVHTSKSAKVLPPELDIFSIPPSQDAIEQDISVECRPISQVDLRHPVTFRIQCAENEYLKWSETEISALLELNLTKVDRSDMTGTEWRKVGVVNNVLHSMIQDARISYKNREVTLNPQNYAYKSYFEDLFGFPREAKESYMHCALWTQDKANDMDNIPESRYDLYAPSDPKSTTTTIELMGRPHFDIAHQPRAQLGSCEFTVTFTFQPTEFFIISRDSNLVLTPSLKEFVLNVHMAKVSPDILAAHNRLLNSNPAVYPFTRTEVKTFHILAQQRDAYLDNVALGRLPRRIFFGLVSNSAYTGNVSKNPFNFQHFNINYVACFVNGVQYPTKALTPDFTSKRYLPAYHGLFEALNQDAHHVSTTISRNDYSRGYTIFGFNFAPDLSDGAFGGAHINHPKHGSLRISLGFSTPTTETLNAVVYCEYDNILVVDKNRDPFTDYQVWTPLQ